MGLFRKKEKINVIEKIYSQDLLKRMIMFISGLIIISLAFNIFILPNNIVYGVSGIGVILKSLFNLDPSLVIFIGSVLLLVLSFVLMGKEKTANSIIGSLLYPLFIKLTEWIIPYVDLGSTEPFLVAAIGAALSGIGLGLIFKAGYTTGGTDILNQVVAKYFKMSIGNAMFFTDGLIIVGGLFVFGWQQFIYSILSIALISVMTDKVILGISQSKTFYIITSLENEVKKFIIDNLSYGVTIIDVHGGYTGKSKRMIMCTIPTKEYFKLKEGIHQIDPEAFFIITDAYEVSGGQVS